MAAVIPNQQPHDNRRRANTDEREVGTYVSAGAGGRWRVGKRRRARYGHQGGRRHTWTGECNAGGRRRQRGRGLRLAH